VRIEEESCLPEKAGHLVGDNSRFKLQNQNTIGLEEEAWKASPIVTMGWKPMENE